jgi:hypothetical protein
VKIVRRMTVVVLGFLGISTIAGAIPLILSPSGELMHMSLSMLQYSPFHSFLIPGIILLLANGAMSLMVLFATLRRWSGYGWWVAFQGCVIAGWIAIEVFLLRSVVWPHYFYAAIGLVLIVLGIVLTREKRTV